MFGPWLQGFVQIGQTMGQIAQWFYIAQESGRACQRFYNGLSLEQQKQVDGIIRWGVKQVLMKCLLPDVLGAVGDQVMQLVDNQAVAEIAQHAVKRAAEIGIDAALEEAHNA